MCLQNSCFQLNYNQYLVPQDVAMQQCDEVTMLVQPTSAQDCIDYATQLALTNTATAVYQNGVGNQIDAASITATTTGYCMASSTGTSPRVFKFEIFNTATASVAQCAGADWHCACIPTLPYATLRGTEMEVLQINFDADASGTTLLTEGDCCERYAKNAIRLQSAMF